MHLEEKNEQDDQQRSPSETTPEDTQDKPVPEVEQTTGLRLDLSRLQLAVSMVKDEVHKTLVGQEEMLDLLLAALLTNGHVLIEGVPGIAKTLTAKLLSQTLAVGFSRIQFTPDLMPSDVVGTTVFNMK
ncbi:MAG: AAA family ATPase, partial [Saprospiraceae bacterium]|nr:AAA family ATPase [Saprospiraceae bacterium]